MNHHCVLHHDWDGCRCRHGGHLRDEGHDGDGGRCRRCGLVRDEEHDFATIRCQVVGQRCGWHSGWNHRWQECACAICGKERHIWNDGVCCKCGERCRHPQSAWYWHGPTESFTPQGCGIVSGVRCGQALGQVERDGERATV